MEKAILISIIVVVILIAFWAYATISASAKLVPEKEYDRSNVCAFWIGRGCPGNKIPSELSGWCEGRNDCKERCGKLGIPTDNCE